MDWLSAWLSAAPIGALAEIDESRRERQAASRRHARGQSNNQTKALDIIDRQEGSAGSMDDFTKIILARPDPDDGLLRGMDQNLKKDDTR